MGRTIMNISILSLTEKNKYAVVNMLQSLENARVYCSYLDNSELILELEAMIERLEKRIERKINENY